MSALPLKLKSTDGQATPMSGALAGSASEPSGLDIPPPIPTVKATREQIRASLELGLAQARAGIGEDFEVVQARLRAKFFPSSR